MTAVLHNSASNALPCGVPATVSDRPPNYVQVVVGKRAEPSGDPEADGRDLARQCLEQIDRRRFPPRLFVLWATPDFQPYEQVLAGIRAELAASKAADVPLIGTSAAAVWFDQKVREHGVLLICLASKLIDAKVAVAERAQDDPIRAAGQLLDRLRSAKGADINPRGNRHLMIYLPGYSDDLDPAQYVAPEIVDEINRQTFGRVHMFGGVSSGGLEPGVGSQFLGTASFSEQPWPR